MRTVLVLMVAVVMTLAAQFEPDAAQQKAHMAHALGALDAWAVFEGSSLLTLRTGDAMRSWRTAWTR